MLLQEKQTEKMRDQLSDKLIQIVAIKKRLKMKKKRIKEKLKIKRL